MSTKLELLIELDSKGAVQGVKALNTEVDKLGQTSKTTTGEGKNLFATIVGGVTAASFLTKGIGELTNFVKDSAKAFIEAEKQQSRLNIALKYSGENVIESNKQISDYADKMEYLTGVNDDQIKSLEILARQYEIQKDRIDESIKGAIALTEIGGTLESNLKAIANAYNGNWAQLGKLIPEIRAANTESERMDILQRAITTGFEMSTEAMKTNAGALKELANWWDDFKKSAGEGIIKGIRLADMAFLGNKKIVKEWAREMATAKQRFDDLAVSSLNRFKSTSGLQATPSLSQLGFIDIESDLAAGEAQYKTFATAIDEAAKSTGKLVEAEKTLIEIMNERWDAFNKNLAQDEAYAAFIESKLGPAINSHSDAWADNTDILKANEEMEKRLGPAIVDTTTVVKEAADQTEKWYKDAQDLTAGLTALANVFDDLIPGLGKLISGIMGAYEATTKFAAASAAGTATLGGFLGMAGAVIGGFMALSNAYDAYVQGQQRDFIQGINEGIKVSEEMAEKIRVLAQEVANLSSRSEEFHESWNMPIKFNIDPTWDEFAAATSKVLGDIIAQTDMSIESFDEWAQRTRDILADFDRNALTAAETTKALGNAFTALITKAKALGTEGSASILKLMDDLNSRGIRVKEIQDYINANWKAGLEGYKKYLEGDFSKATIGVFEYLLAYEKKVGANQALVDGIQGITQALIGMSNVIELTEEEFDKFEMAGRDAYDKLIAQGFTSRESLMQLQPMLSRLIYLQKEYGLTIDAATQALIDKAKADGVDLSLVKSQDEVFGDMASSLAELVDIFRNVFPKAIEPTIDAFRKLNEVANNFDPNTTYNPKQPDYEPAATGWQGWVAGGSNKRFITGETEPEYVSITPMSKMRGSDAAPGGGGSKTIINNWHLYNVITPENVVPAIKTAYLNNTQGLKSLLEN